MDENNVTNEPVQKSRWGKRNSIGIAVIVVLLAAVLYLGFSAWKDNQIVSIKAAYDGPTQAGTMLDSTNTGIRVTGRTRKRSEVEIPFGEWSVDEAKSLAADVDSVVRIRYRGKTCELRVTCTDSQTASIQISYSGKTDAGTVISHAAEGFSVTATLRNGTEIDITDTCVMDNGEVTLMENRSSTVSVSYTDPFNHKVYSDSLDVICSTKTVKQISAKYIGEALEGELLDSSNRNFVVTATYDNGSVEQVQDWTIREASTVTRSTSTPVTIWYGGKETTIVVECRDYDPDVYRKNCSRYPYTELVRFPDNYIGAMISVRGRINQVYEGTTSSSRCSYQIRVGYRQYMNVEFQGTLDRGNLIEGDWITCYGTFMGLDHNDNSYPLISARILER